MLSKVVSKKIGDRSGSEKLLSEIETISKALYLNKNPSKNSNSGATARQRSIGKTNLPDPKWKPKSVHEDPTRKDKKSIWSWKTLKAFSHVRNRRFNCCFSLQVHSIKGLPSDFDDLSLSVFWKRRDGLLITRPKKVVQGKVEFEEELNCTCTVHGSGNGPHHSAKYEAKHFLLYASVYGASEIDLGKHRVDLTRLLPLTLEELEEEKSSGKWATTFKLSGKAKGATMNVSFGYTVVGDNSTAPANHIGDSLKVKQNKHGIGKSEMMLGESGGRSRIQNTESLIGRMNNDSLLVSSRSIDDIKDLHEVLPIPQLELAKSVDVLYKKFDDGKLDVSADSNPHLDVCTEYSHPMKSDSCSSAPENANADIDYGAEFSFVERGIEVSSEEQVEKIKESSEVQVEKTVVPDEITCFINLREYFKQGKLEQFCQILEEGSSPEIDEYYADVRYERIAILNALGAYYSYLGKIETKQQEKEEHFILATQYYNKASRIDMHEPSTWVGKGQLLLTKGEVEQAFAAFKIVLDGDRDNVPALLGQAFLDLGELLISTDEGAALDAFKTASNLLRKGGQEVPIEVLNNLGVLHFEREEFELAERIFKEALGDGIWLDFIDGKERCPAIEASVSVLQYKDMELFYRLEREGRSIVLPWKKVTTLFNLARLLEQLHNIEVASVLNCLILFKYPDYVDAYLRLASIAKARNYVQLSIELVNDALKVNEMDNELLMTHEEGSRVDHREEKHDNYTEELVACNISSNDHDICTKESILRELESALSCVSELETATLESPEEELENNSDFKSSDETTGKARPPDLHDEFLESDFLRMLGLEQSPFGLSSESEPESPRERLLRQFEEEVVSGGYSLFNFDIEDENHPACGYNFNDSSEFEIMDDTPFDLPSTFNTNEGMYFTEDETVSKMKAKMLEDLETQVLMHEWGLNEEAFQQSPPSSSHGFGSPVNLPCEEPFDLPPLGEGLGSFIQTKNGGFLRSMNPAIFQNAKSGGNLIMQVSSPVVVPAEMGSGIMEILQRLASVGIEKLSMQATKLMPLEDITGKTMQQVAWEAIPTLEGSERQHMPQNEPIFEQDPFDRRKNSMGRSSGSRHEKFSSNSMRGEPETEYVSLEDVAPLALDKIEALSIEGLRIQSGMSEDEAPSNISAQSIGEFSALRGKGIDISGSLGLEGTAGLQLLDIKDNGDDVDGLMGLSLSLDEWMRLDSGELDDEEIISEHTSKILAAHHANSLDFIRGGAKGDRRRGKSSSRKCGLLGNNFTVALMVQLRDPLRNYEPVGAPMLSLIQVERVFIPPKPKIYSTVSEIRNNYDDEDDLESVTRVEKKEEPEEKTSEQQGIPQFRITEVHVAGIKTEPNKKLWSTSTSSQQKSGSRWLLANGMGKSNKHPFLKTKAAPKSLAPEPTKVQPGDKDKDSLWSISSGAKWKAFSALNPHVRNPNVVFPKENFRLR